MVKRKTKQALEGKLNELKMNLENNYKDLARTALKEYQELLAPGFFDDMKKIADLAFRTLHHEVGQAASALDADAWKFSELLSDQLKLLIH